MFLFRCNDVKFEAHIEDAEATIAFPLDKTDVTKNPLTWPKLRFAEIKEVEIRPMFTLKNLKHDAWEPRGETTQCGHDYNRPINEVDVVAVPIWELFCSVVSKALQTITCENCQTFKNWFTRIALERGLKSLLNKKLKGKGIFGREAQTVAKK